MSIHRLLTCTLPVAGAVVIAALSGGCNTVDCAEGTIERGGECVPADEAFDNATCGVGTMLQSNQCVAIHEPTVCGVGTVEDRQIEPGIITCVGVGGTGCDFDLRCGSAAAGKVSVCGRLFDVETDQRIEGVEATGLPCTSENAVQEGPCQLDVKFYDAVQFAGNPTGATPLTVEDFVLDDCGRYSATNIQRPDLTFLGIAVDDRAGQGNNRELTGVAFGPVASAQVFSNQRTYSMAVATNTAWSSQVGLNPTFVSRGVFMSIFLHGRDPVPGVRVIDTTRPNTTGDDYYFDDAEPFSRQLVSASGPAGDNRTGPNGVALLLNSGLALHTGEGAEPTGCVWPTDQAASVPGVLFINPREAHPTGNPNGACP
jgi:hypothetical protein